MIANWRYILAIPSAVKRDFELIGDSKRKDYEEVKKLSEFYATTCPGKEVIILEAKEVAVAECTYTTTWTVVSESQNEPDVKEEDKRIPFPWD